MSSVGSLFKSFIFMILLISLGLVLNYSLGVSGDVLYDTLVDVGVFNVNADWDPTGNVDWLFAVLRGLGYLLPVAGVVVFLVSALRRERFEDEYQYSGSGGEGGGGLYLR